MNKVIFILPGALPVPNVKGGAVETLVQMLIDENEKMNDFEFYIFSPYDFSAKASSSKYLNSKFVFIDQSKWQYRIKKIIFSLFNRFTGLYVGNQFIRCVTKKILEMDFVNHVFVVENSPEYALTIRKHFPHSKIIQHIHNSYLFDGYRRRDKILKDTNAIFCVSNYVRNGIMKAGSGRCLLKLLYNGIDTKKFCGNISKSQKDLLRLRLGIAVDRFVFIFSGRLVKHKGILELIEAFKFLSRRYCFLTLLIVGSGPIEKEKQELRDSLGEVIFLGRVDYNRIQDIYQAADAAVVPSTWEEPFGLTCVEALCSGLPTVVTDSGGMLEIIDEDSAVVAKKGDELAKNLEISMEKIIINKNLRERLSRKARKRGEIFSLSNYWLNFSRETKKIIKDNEIAF